MFFLKIDTSHRETIRRKGGEAMYQDAADIEGDDDD